MRGWWGKVGACADLYQARSPQHLALLAALCPGYTQCPALNYPAISQSAPALALQANLDTARDNAFAASQVPGVPFGNQIALLGQAIANDRTLSAGKTQACLSCHQPSQGFAGGLPAYNPGGGVVDGAQPWRTWFRRPQSLAYSGFAPNLRYNAKTGEFIGGAFWDSRATGEITGSAAADQALQPFTNPAEMALPDPACAVRAVQNAAYGPAFGSIWSPDTYNIAWPANVDSLCASPGSGGAATLPLSTASRAQATQSLNFIVQTILAYESSTLSATFTSKYDAYLAGHATLTPAEAHGLALFKGRAHCNECHTATGTRPLFTDFTSSNNGTPRNLKLAYLRENAADPLGYTANAAGKSFVDTGLGGFLAGSGNPSWAAQAPRFMGAFQVPTLRNVAAGQRPYMHNGVFPTLKMVVHFYNTRDVLPRCTGAAGNGVTCWPAPEVAANENTTQIGKLGLTASEEAAIVAFLGTLTDGFSG